MHAYEHGIVIVFADGIARRVYPRFFTYGADYPEKYVVLLYDFLSVPHIITRVLLASIRFLARCPCPRCLIEKSQIHELGTTRDQQRRKRTRIDSHLRQQKVEMARGWIFEKGYGVRNAAVERVLAPESLVPTRVMNSIS
jgi:hypothetical protein